MLLLLSNRIRAFSALSITLIALGLSIASAGVAGAQLTGTLNIPGDYPTLADAITALNTQGVAAGGVTLNLLAGNAETAPAGGYVIGGAGSLVLTTTSSGNSVTIQGNGNTITASAAHTVGALTDAVFKLIGADWITVTGFILQENPANTTTTPASNNMTEWAVALLHVSTTDGAQDNTIQGNTISLNRTYTNTWGVYANNRHSATNVTTTEDVTNNTTGPNSRNRVYGNIISNVNMGVAFIGTSAAANQDVGNSVGGASAPTGNAITNWGGAAAASGYISNSGTSYCIFMNHQTGDNVSYNTVTSAAVSGTSVTFRGIFKDYTATAPTGTFTSTITNNTVTMTSGFTSGTFEGIRSQGMSALSTATIIIDNNTILNCAVTGASSSSAIVGIVNSSVPGTVSISNNVVRGTTSTATTGGFTGVQNAGAVATAINLNNNQIGNASGGAITFSAATSGAVYGVYNSAGAATCALSIQGNDIRGIVHSVAGSSGHNYIYNSAATLSQNISSNTYTNLNVNTTGTVYFIYNSVTAPAGGSKTINSNSIVTAYNKAGAGGTVYAYYDFASSGATVVENNNSNNFSNITVTGATTVSGWYNQDGGAPVKTIQNNTFTNWAGGTSAIVVMNLNYGTSATITQNTVTGITGGGAITGVSLGSSFTLANLTQNVVGGLASTGAAAVQGITSAATTSNIVRNKVYDLSGSNPSTTVNGLLVSSGTTVTATNNLIGDLRATAATSTSDVVRGVSLTSSTTSSSINLYDNSIYLNAASAGANFSTSGIFHTTSATGTTAALNLRGNIIVNLSTPNGTGLTVAYRRSSTALNNYATTSNNNLFYAGTPGANRLIFYDGTNSDQTLAAFKTRVSPREGSSVTENPPFLSTVGTNPNFLHIDPAIGTQVESAGQAIAGVTDDFDGEARNGTTPDIGADEGTFTLADITGPSIAFTPPGNTATLGDRTLTATITDPSGVPTSGIGLPVLYWKIGAGAYAAATATYLSGNSYQFTFGAGAVYPDVVSYYICAQDNAGTPNVSCSPAGGAAGLTANPPAAATPPTSPWTYQILQGISGTFTVGLTRSDYPTLTAAVTDLNAKVLTGAVTFLLTDATYPTETFPITIAANGGSSATNTVLIRPNAGVTTTISGTVASGTLIKLDGADYVTIDGSNSGGSDRSLTITNAATTAPCVIWISSQGLGLGAANNTVKNCNLNANAATSATAYGIAVSGSTIASQGSDNDNTTLQNNAINSFNVGIYSSGGAAISAGGMDNLTVTGNAFTSTSTASPTYGVQVAYAINAAVSLNTFNLVTTASTAPVGISIEASVSNSSVTANRTTSVVTSATGGYGGRGITVGTGTTGSNITIANNFIAGVNGSNYSGFGNSSSMGIAVGVVGNSSTLTTVAGGVKLYHNSVNMAGTYSYGAACLTAAVYVGSGASALDIRNNIFLNSMSNTNSLGLTSKNYTVYSAATNTAYVPISYNDYYVSGTQGMLGYLGGDLATLSAFNTAFTGNPSTPSLSVIAPFVSATDLHIPAATMTMLESAGASGLSVAVDIDNETRPGPPGSVNGGGTAPDPGADEFDGTPASENDMAATAFVDPVNGGTKSVGTAFTPQASFSNLGLNAQTNVTVRYRIVGPAPGTDEVYNQTAVIASLASMTATTVSFPGVTLTTAGSYAIYAVSELAGDQVPANDQITGSMSALEPLAGTYYVGGGLFKQLTGLNNLTFERRVRTVRKQVLEPADPAPKALPGEARPSTTEPDHIVWKTVDREVDEVTWVALVNGKPYDRPLRISRHEDPTLPVDLRDGVYATITAAVADLNSRGVGGPVTFLLTDATYPSETYPIVVNVTSGAPTAEKPVTIKPNTGVTTTVSGASASSAIFKVLNTNYITIDGSNVALGTTRDMTIENTSATSPEVVWFGSSGTTPVTNGTLKNCVVRNGVNTSSAVLISDGTVAGNPGYFSNIEVRNNKIEKAFNGVYANGGTTTPNGLNLTYAENDLTTSGTNAIRKVGLYMQGVSGGLVEKNDIANFETATGENDYGIWLATGTANVTVNANRVHDLHYTGTSGYGPKGVVASTGVTLANVTVSNNMIFNLTGDGDSYTSYGCTYNPVGVYAFGSTVQGGVNILDNSIFLYGNTINYSADAYSVGIGLDDNNTGSVFGNNVVNNLGRLSATGKGAVAIALETAASQLTGANHNNLYCNSTGGGSNSVGKIGSTDYAALADWRTASGQDANSIAGDPKYVSSTDLHIRQDVISPVSNAGAPIAGITLDYDANTRDGVTPDIGADEFTIYVLTTQVVGSGSIQVAPAQEAYAPGTQVTLTATPADLCQTFAGWSGDASGNTNPLVITMNANMSITATFDAVLAPTVAVTNPNGGDSLVVGSTYQVTWTAAGGTALTIDLAYSEDGGVTYPHVIALGLPNTGTHDWIVPATPTTLARLRVTAHDLCAHIVQDASDANFTIVTQVDAVAENLLHAGEVLGVYPNPADPGNANILYRLPAGVVSVDIYDVTGRLVRRLDSGNFAGGVQSVRWDGRGSNGELLPAGIYLVRLHSSAGRSATKRLVLVRQ